MKKDERKIYENYYKKLEQNEEAGKQEINKHKPGWVRVGFTCLGILCAMYGFMLLFGTLFESIFPNLEGVKGLGSVVGFFITIGWVSVFETTMRKYGEVDAIKKKRYFERTSEEIRKWEKLDKIVDNKS